MLVTGKASSQRELVTLLPAIKLYHELKKKRLHAFEILMNVLVSRIERIDFFTCKERSAGTTGWSQRWYEERPERTWACYPIGSSNQLQKSKINSWWRQVESYEHVTMDPQHKRRNVTQPSVAHATPHPCFKFINSWFCQSQFLFWQCHCFCHSESTSQIMVASWLKTWLAKTTWNLYSRPTLVFGIEDHLAHTPETAYQIQPGEIHTPSHSALPSVVVHNLQTYMNT